MKRTHEVRNSMGYPQLVGESRAANALYTLAGVGILFFFGFIFEQWLTSGGR